MKLRHRALLALVFLLAAAALLLLGQALPAQDTLGFAPDEWTCGAADGECAIDATVRIGPGSLSGCENPSEGQAVFVAGAAAFDCRPPGGLTAQQRTELAASRGAAAASSFAYDSAVHALSLNDLEGNERTVSIFEGACSTVEGTGAAGQTLHYKEAGSLDKPICQWEADDTAAGGTGLDAAAVRAQTTAQLRAGANVTLTPAGSGATQTLTIAAGVTAPSTDATTLEVRGSLPATTGFAAGDIINLNGVLMELVDDADESNVLTGTIGAVGSSMYGTVAFNWGVADPFDVRALLSRTALGSPPPATLYVSVHLSDGETSSLIRLDRAGGSDTATQLAYHKRPGDPGLEGTGGTFTVRFYTDAAKRTPQDVHDADRWETAIREHHQDVPNDRLYPESGTTHQYAGWDGSGNPVAKDFPHSTILHDGAAIGIEITSGGLRHNNLALYDPPGDALSRFDLDEYSYGEISVNMVLQIADGASPSGVGFGAERAQRWVFQNIDFITHLKPPALADYSLSDPATWERLDSVRIEDADSSVNDGKRGTLTLYHAHDADNDLGYFLLYDGAHDSTTTIRVAASYVVVFTPSDGIAAVVDTADPVTEEAVYDQVKQIFTAGANVSLAKSDSTNRIEVSATASSGSSTAEFTLSASPAAAVTVTTPAGSATGAFSAWTTLAAARALTAAEAGTVLLLAHAHAEAQGTPAGGGDRLKMESRITRTRSSVTTPLRDNLDYGPRYLPAASGTTSQAFSEATKLADETLVLSDEAEAGDVYAFQVRVVQQAVSGTRSVVFGTARNTLTVLPVGRVRGAGLSEAQVNARVDALVEEWALQAWQAGDPKAPTARLGSGPASRSTALAGSREWRAAPFLSGHAVPEGTAVEMLVNHVSIRQDLDLTWAYDATNRVWFANLPADSDWEQVRYNPSATNVLANVYADRFWAFARPGRSPSEIALFVGSRRIPVSVVSGAGTRPVSTATWPSASWTPDQDPTSTFQIETSPNQYAFRTDPDVWTKVDSPTFAARAKLVPRPSADAAAADRPRLKIVADDDGAAKWIPWSVLQALLEPRKLWTMNDDFRARQAQASNTWSDISATGDLIALSSIPDNAELRVVYQYPGRTGKQASRWFPAWQLKTLPDASTVAGGQSAPGRELQTEAPPTILTELMPASDNFNYAASPNSIRINTRGLDNIYLGNWDGYLVLRSENAGYMGSGFVFELWAKTSYTP